MKFLHAPARLGRTLAVFAPTVATLATLLVPTTAHAATDVPLTLDVLGEGTTYADGASSFTALPVAPTGVATFYVRVNNVAGDGPVTALELTAAEAGWIGINDPATVKVYPSGSSIALAGTTNGATTKYDISEISPGQSATFRVTIDPLGPGQPHASFSVASRVWDSGYEYFGGTTIAAFTTPPFAGNDAFDLRVRAGSQAWVGGTDDHVVASGKAFGSGSSQTYTVSLRNRSMTTTTESLRLTAGGESACWNFKATIGLTDVTTQLTSGDFSRKMLPGQTVNITITVTRTAAGCRALTVNVAALDATQAIRREHILVGNAMAGTVG